jgi:2-phospho-L-lactate/phosphoenolpyruvate guanylyltransferase
MTIWAIVPVKPLRAGKSRLAGVLTAEQREALNLNLLSHTLDTLKEVPEITSILVVSRDPAALAQARARGALTVQESGQPQLNEALKRATVTTRRYDVSAVLILPADLPLLNPPDVRLLLKQSPPAPGVAIVPDRRQEGTNALLVSPPGLIDYDYGPGSFQRHCTRARQAGASLVVLDIPSLALDVDLPEDLELVRERMDLP